MQTQKMQNSVVPNNAMPVFPILARFLRFSFLLAQ